MVVHSPMATMDEQVLAEHHIVCMCFKGFPLRFIFFFLFNEQVCIGATGKTERMYCLN